MIIPREIVEQLNELPIEDVAERVGLVVKKHKARCFMHDDHHPSLSFNTKKNMFFCFVCNKGGGPIQLLMCLNKEWTFQDACLWLAKEFKVIIAENKGYAPKRAPRPNPVKKTPKKVEIEKHIDREIGEWIIEHSLLSDIAKHFLFEERKYKEGIVSALKIGSLTYPQKLTEVLIKHFGLERCAQSGFFNRWGKGIRICYQAPCLLFPYYDENGELYCIQSRFLGEVKDKKDRFKFPKDIKQRLFNRPILKDIKPNEPLYVCEGVTDCIAMLSSGKKAVAFPSSSICHPEDVRLLSSYYLFMYPDKDKAGEGLYKKLTDELKSYSNIVHKVDYPEGYGDYSDYYISLQ